MLSLAMHHALARIRSEPNQERYKGVRKSTVDALTRRGLVWRNVYGGLHATRLGREIHVHQWGLGLHMDGCHYYTSTYACECGAALSTYGERDLKADPYSMIWMEPEGSEDDPEFEPCERCRELMDGARPIWRVVMDEPKAKVPA